MRAEQKLSATREHDAHVRLGAAAVAQVQGTEHLRRGHSAGHVASLASYHRRGSRAVRPLPSTSPTRGTTMTFPATTRLRQERTTAFRPQPSHYPQCRPGGIRGYPACPAAWLAELVGAAG